MRTTVKSLGAILTTSLMLFSCASSKCPEVTIWGVPAYETESYSPCCHGDWEDYYPCCELCGSYEDGRCTFTGEEVDTADLCKDYELSSEREYYGHI